MSEPRSEHPRRNRPESAHAERLRSAPLTDTEIPVTGSGDDILGSTPAPSDDSPTIISKNSPRPAPAPDDGLRGRHLAHFELLEQIGAGGMAAVLRARDTQLDRIVALKILPPDMAADPENVLRFHQEARSAAKLDHENIARVFFCGEDQRLQFIAFEFVEGENLRTILDHRGRLPVGEALPYVLQVAAGLAHAAERGVVHRDIKPSNIIITPSGRAKLVDMGLARSLGPQKDAGLTHSGVTLGTFDYISPEQALEPRDADVRSDIYSLGCTFYHMVTGRAPVPEGTAAKKLHHHQHIPPPDPRELVPGLPDEIALILDRMMAKDQRARYQTAGELVQHLLTAAKKLRVGAEVPEGVLFVETPLPRTGGGRPYLLVGLAVAAVVALILFLDQPAGPPPASRPKPQPSTSRNGADNDSGRTDNADDKKTDRKVDPNPVQPDPAKPLPVRFTYTRDKTPQNLFDWLEANRSARHIELVLARDLDLEVKPDGGTPELVIAADEVTVQPEKGVRPTIRLTYIGGTNTERAALRLRARETKVRDIQFVIDGAGSDVPLIGLALDGEKHEVLNCDFVQKKPSPQDPKGNRLTSLSVTRRAGGRPPELKLTGDTFLGFKSDQSPKGREVGGQDAVARRGAVRISAKDCAFGPHQTTFRLEGDETVQLDHCSVMAADQSAVFYLLPGASATFDVSHSLFSRPGGFGPVFETEPAGAVLVRRASDRDYFYNGTDNRYHNLTALPPGTPDDHSFVLKGISPWENDRAIETPGDDLLARTFAPKRNLPELRQSDAKTTNLIGVETLASQSLTDHLPPVVDRAPEQLTVDPTAPRSDSARGVFITLEEAVAAVEAAKPGEAKTIAIRCDGVVTVGKGLRLERRNMDLTIKAAAGSRPVLILGQSSDRDAALFRLHDGHLQIEDLELRLRPPQPELGKPTYLSQAVVALMGDGQCAFKNCLITLDQGNQTDTKLAVATLPALDNVMKMDMKTEPTVPRPEGRPHLWFTNCFVRGTGDVVWNQTGRPCDLDANRALFALIGDGHGSLLNVEVTPSTDITAAPSKINLERTTTFLAGPLLRVQGKEVKDVQKVPAYQVSANESLFLPASDAQALVRFETKDLETDNPEEKLPARFSWEMGKTNGFGTFDPFVAHAQIDGTAQSGIDLGGWRKLSNSPQSKYRIAVADPTARETLFRDATSIKPSQLRAPEQLDLGADTAALQKLLPGPR